MNIKDYKKAEVLVNQIDSIKDLTKDFELGRVSDSNEFEENNDDFYSSNFIRVFETKGYHSTGGGSCDLSRMTIAKYKDMSGSKYELSKTETIQLQKFLKSMLDKRLDKLVSDLESL